MTTSANDRRGSTAYVFLLASVAALGGLLFGYDTAVISGAIGFLEIHFQLDPEVTTGWAAACALIGCAAGAALAGVLSDRFGRKRVLMLSAVLFLVSAWGTALPRTFWEFVVYRIIGGLGVGAASLTSPLYIAEISPARIRGRMVSVNQFAIVTGMLIVYFVNYFIGGYGTSLDRRCRADYLAAHPPPGVSPLVVELVVDQGAAADLDAAREFLAAHNTALDEPLLERFHGSCRDLAADVDAGLRAEQGYAYWNAQLGWRWMFGSEAVPAVLLLLLMFCVPESPRWLSKQGHRRQALTILAKAGGADHATAELADIEDAIAHESGSVWQLFSPGLRLVLLFGVVLAILQQVTGINVFLYYAPEIFKSMGSGVDTSLLQTVLVGAVNLSFTILAIWSVDRLGRKPLMLIGYTGMGLSLTAVGLAAYFEQTAVWVLAFVLSYIACFALSVGPVTWVILSEVFPTRIRGRAMAIATVCLWLANYVVTQTFTMMKENEYLVDKFHYAFPYWVYAVLCAVSMVFVWRFLPETKGRTLEQIERDWLR